ncbi:hypothetical protein TEA_004693 [Camellia sinensis var. sinensis]|uniref:RRM domain-containing protein n=1 Tax=Camellia sinensis var. sinensis TaxID=542762 RepID=A0A4S4DDR7_CAMSN|nr:hypothetical protein TEA_004693 [Camellia sinensis var. sinensis]
MGTVIGSPSGIGSRIRYGPGKFSSWGQGVCSPAPPRPVAIPLSLPTGSAPPLPLQEAQASQVVESTSEEEEPKREEVFAVVMVSALSDTGQSKTAFITFKDPKALEIALLLSAFHPDIDPCLSGLNFL